MAGELGRAWSLPLMPTGFTLFEALPVGALVLDALAPVIGNGMITMSDGAVVDKKAPAKAPVHHTTTHH